jgi:NADPH:quinone reductase-like Zn-dependent oxidoreductase
MMKALQLSKGLEAPSPTLSLVNLPVPVSTRGLALVKIQYSCIHPSDRFNSIGGFPKITFPRIPGRDYSGTVVELKHSSDAASTKWIGKRVYGTGGAELGFKMNGPHAQYCLIPENMLVEKPDAISLVQAATVGVPFTTALRCLMRARAKPDDVVLVLGASGVVGSSAVQVARAIGCRRVLTATRNEDDHPHILLGGDIGAEFQSKIPLLTDNEGVTVVIDTIGNLDIMGSAIQTLAVKGRYAWIAAPRGEGAMTKLSFDIFEAYRKEIELVGCNSGLATPEDIAEEMQTLSYFFEHDLIQPRDETLLDVISLDDAVEKGKGYRTSPKGKQTVIKLD